MNVFIVDDNPHVVSIASRWLSEAGYIVSASNDFLEATVQLQVEAPDVLLVDVRLGEFNGLQLAIRARESHPEAKIVIMSAWDDPVLKRDAEQCGASYIVKPFNEKELLAAIKSPN
jgi:DNA-binding response OmpR family regulator